MRDEEKLIHGEPIEELIEAKLEPGRPERTIKLGPSPDEPKPWLLLVDGSKTKIASGAGLVLQSPEGAKFKYVLRFRFQATNNQAEYEALITGSQLARAVGVGSLAVISDSQLVVGQVNREYEAKEENMENYLELVKELIRGFQAFNISQVPREENTEADQLARLATAKENLIPGGVMMQYLDAPSIAKPVNEVQIVEYKGTWADPIVRYIKNGEVPDDKSQARKLRIKAANYALMGDVLYRRSFTLPYLRCLIPTEAEHAMGEVHEGIYGEAITVEGHWPIS
ncbi:hypothetical protein Vadar_023323 [Vaccinium darrowii]|uniref:Uncharacterized protein n=1 Tax=Vaccinium darrowii TaxID=229202 RepID=A0ACB7YGS7_9ERIC|nr:hypothetical protein Vadar_023323 [Vaccinium darrowii]